MYGKLITNTNFRIQILNCLGGKINRKYNTSFNSTKGEHAWEVVI